MRVVRGEGGETGKGKFVGGSLLEEVCWRKFVGESFIHEVDTSRQ